MLDILDFPLRYLIAGAFVTLFLGVAEWDIMLPNRRFGRPSGKRVVAVFLGSLVVVALADLFNFPFGIAAILGIYLLGRTGVVLWGVSRSGREMGAVVQDLGIAPRPWLRCWEPALVIATMIALFVLSRDTAGLIFFQAAWLLSSLVSTFLPWIHRAIHEKGLFVPPTSLRWTELDAFQLGLYDKREIRFKLNSAGPELLVLRLSPEQRESIAAELIRRGIRDDSRTTKNA
jgi:hypothetical protein